MEHTFLPTSASTPTDSDSLSQLLDDIQQSQPQQQAAASIYLSFPSLLSSNSEPSEPTALTQQQPASQALQSDFSQLSIFPLDSACSSEATNSLSIFGISLNSDTVHYSPPAANNNLMDTDTRGGFSAEPLAAHTMTPGSPTTPSLHSLFSAFVPPATSGTLLFGTPDSTFSPYHTHVRSSRVAPSLAPYGYWQPLGPSSYLQAAQPGIAGNFDSSGGFLAESSSLLLASTATQVPAPLCSISVTPPEQPQAPQTLVSCTPALADADAPMHELNPQSRRGSTRPSSSCIRNKRGGDARQHSRSPLQGKAATGTDTCSCYLSTSCNSSRKGSRSSSRSSSVSMPRALTPETFQQAQRQLQPSAVAASFADSQTAASADPDDGNDDDDSDPATSHSRSYSRSPVTKEQKWALYTWLIENVNYPYPREEDMNGLLNVDNMDAAKFKTWFANTRKRQFYKVRTSTGDKLFIPNTKFFETCRRLGIVVPSALLEQSMCLAKQHNIQTCPTGLN